MLRQQQYLRCVKSAAPIKRTTKNAPHLAEYLSILYYMKPTIPVVYGYNNFRTFLADYQEARQVFEPTFSKSEFSRRLGLPNTRSFFTDALHGKKVTPAFVERFISVMKLNKEETQFFRVLVLYNQAELSEERELYFEQLINLNKTPKRIIDPKHYAYYKNWYNSVIRAVLTIIDWKEDYSVLAKRVYPAISVKQAKASIKLLSHLGLIAKNSEGYFKPTDRVIATNEFCRDEIIRLYQHNCLENARIVISGNKKQPQRLITKMVSVSEEGYRKIEKKLEQFNSAITSLVHKEETAADRVYQIAIVIFPQSTRLNP
jgi:uncharacterized protein (TIGR02147 family)